MLIAVAAVPVVIWLYLLFGRGGFCRVSIEHKAEQMAEHQAPRAAARRVVAVIPARNEAAVLGRALESLAPQVSHVVVIDDGSTDGTAETARALNRNITVLEGRPLAPGWTGKLWALAQGVDYAETLAPDYLLFTDADIEHGPTSVPELVAIAEARKLDLAS